MDKFKKLKWKTIIPIAVLAVALIIGIIVLLMPYIEMLFDPERQQEFENWISSMGIAGWLLVLAIQIIQIIIAFIPGEPVEIIAGVLYGPWGGLFICLLGCLIASSITFTVAQFWGNKLLYRLFGKEKIEGFAFLKNAKRFETVTFILFLIPGTPKDMLTYVAGVSKIKRTRFLVISTFARIPSILSSTFMGATIQQGQWGIFIAIFLITAAIGLLGIKYSDKAIKYCRIISFPDNR